MKRLAELTCCAAILVGWTITAMADTPKPASAAPDKATGLAFTPEGKGFRFDTGALRGMLRAEGRSRGLTSVVDVATGVSVAGAHGLLSHYRLLDADARYGTAAWDWASTARLLEDGSVEAQWSADPVHPFDLKAVYRWTSPNVLDVQTSVTARKPLRCLEVFLASYFAGFPVTTAYVERNPETGGPGLMEAKKSAGTWQTFPRDDQTEKIFRDGRWKRPPSPVEWKMMPRLAGPLAVRRDAKTGLTALLMAPPSDCFAVSMPHGEEGHRSVYLSLFGRDFAEGQAATARTRLVIGREISDQQAIALYQEFLKP